MSWNHQSKQTSQSKDQSISNNKFQFSLHNFIQDPYLSCNSNSDRQLFEGGQKVQSAATQSAGASDTAAIQMHESSREPGESGEGDLAVGLGIEGQGQQQVLVKQRQGEKTSQVLSGLNGGQVSGYRMHAKGVEVNDNLRRESPTKQKFLQNYIKQNDTDHDDPYGAESITLMNQASASNKVAQGTNVSVEISPQQIEQVSDEKDVAGQPAFDIGHFSPTGKGKFENKNASQNLMNQQKINIKQVQIQKNKNQNEVIAKKNLQLDLSALAMAGIVPQQKIQEYEVKLSQSEKKAGSPTKNKRNRKSKQDFSEFNQLIHEQNNIQQKIAQIREHEKSLFESEESIPIPKTMVSNPNSTKMENESGQGAIIQFEERDDDEDDTALDDLDQSPANMNKNNPLSSIAKGSISIPQSSPKRLKMKTNDPSSLSGSSYRNSYGGGIYKSNQPMNVKSKTSSYFNKANQEYSANGKTDPNNINLGSQEDEEDCNSVNSQDERQLHKDQSEELLSGSKNQHHTSQLLQQQQMMMLTPHKKYTQGQPLLKQDSNKSLINNVNVIDLRALSPGMRHIASNNRAFAIGKKATLVEYQGNVGKKVGRSPKFDKQVNDFRVGLAQIEEKGFETANISTDLLQETSIDIKTFQMRMQDHQGSNHGPGGEKRWSPMFQPHQRIQSKKKSPSQHMIHHGVSKSNFETSKSPKNQDSPQLSINQVIPPNQSQQKRHSMQNAIRQNNRLFKNQLASNHLQQQNLQQQSRYSNISAAQPFNRENEKSPQSFNMRKVSEGVFDQQARMLPAANLKSQNINNSPPMLKSLEINIQKSKKNDIQSSKNFFGSFFYNQQSIGPGSIVSGSDYAPPMGEGGFSPKTVAIDDKKKGTANSSAASTSSYNKFKNFLYNTVKTAQVNYHSKISMNLKDKQFFQPIKDNRDVKTMLLTTKFLNKKSYSQQELEQLNQRFTVAWRGITWFSYRDQIERAIGSKPKEKVSAGLKSDHGWGCMLRTGQMILFQALVRHFMADMTYTEIFQNQKCIQRYFDLLMLFMDNSPPSDTDNITCPFGIHSICQEAKDKLHMVPGQWYGPQMISIVLRNICNTNRPVNQFRIHVCLDGCLFLDEIEKLLNQSNSVFVLVPLRLGMDTISSVYLKQVKYLFQIQQSVGVMGGKDHMAIYLVGDEDVQKNNSGLFYLDPHYVQPSLPSSILQSSSIPAQRFSLPPHALESYHTYDLRTLDPTNMQTSLAPGFYIKDHEQFRKLVRSLKEMQSHFRDQCIFTIYDQKPQWMKDLDSQAGSEPRKKESDQDSMVQDLGPLTLKSSPKDYSNRDRTQAGPSTNEQDDSFEDLKDYEFEGIEQVPQNRRQKFNKQNTQIHTKTMMSIQNSTNDHKVGPNSGLMKPHQQLSSGAQIYRFGTISDPIGSATTISKIQGDFNSGTAESHMQANRHLKLKSQKSDDFENIDQEINQITKGGAHGARQHDGGSKLSGAPGNAGAFSLNITQKYSRQAKNNALSSNQPSAQSLAHQSLSHQTELVRHPNDSSSTPERQVSSRGAKRILPNMPQQLMKQAGNSGSKGQQLPQQVVNSQVIGPRTMMTLNQGKYTHKIGHMQDTGMVNPKNRHSRIKVNTTNQSKALNNQTVGLQNLNRTQTGMIATSQRVLQQSDVRERKGLDGLKERGGQDASHHQSGTQSRNSSNVGTLKAVPTSMTHRPNPNPQQPSPIQKQGTKVGSTMNVPVFRNAPGSGQLALTNSKSMFSTVNQKNQQSKTLEKMSDSKAQPQTSEKQKGTGALSPQNNHQIQSLTLHQQASSSLQPSDSLIILGNVDEGAKDDIYQQNEMYDDFMRQQQHLHDSDSKNKQKLSDNDLAGIGTIQVPNISGKSVITNADALRIHNISAYGTKSKQKLQNFRDKPEKGGYAVLSSGSGVQAQQFGNTASQNVFDQDVGVSPGQQPPQASGNILDGIDDESDDGFEKI